MPGKHPGFFVMVERCSNPSCPRRESRDDYIGPRNAIMVDSPDMPSFAVCSWSCLVVVTQRLSASRQGSDKGDSSVAKWISENNKDARDCTQT